MVRTRPAVALSAATALLLMAGLVGTLRGKDDPPATFHDDFETPRTAWVREQTDAIVNLEAHERSDRAAHDGRTAERFRFEAGLGSSFFYSYPLPKVPVTDELKVSLFVRSTRPGVQVYGRVVLPADTDPDTGQPSFVTVPGTTYDNVDRWQRLELSAMRPSIERQARVLRASSRRTVSLEGAYLERVVVNLFGGAGASEVFLDDLTVSPVPPDPERVAVAVPNPEGPKPVADAPEAPAPGGARPEPDGAGLKVRLERNNLVRTGEDGTPYDWFFTAIQAPGADVAGLRQAGFDVLADKVDGDPSRAKEAIRRGFLLMPDLSATLEGAPVDAERMVAAAQAYPFRDSVAFWDLGGHLGRSPDKAARQAEVERTRAAAAGLRALSGASSRLATGTAEGEAFLFANTPRRLAMIGARPNCWGSAMDPWDTYVYLKQRRDLTVLANPGGLHWAWVPATAPASVVESTWGRDVPPAWGYPQVQPEQVRMFAYLALAAGYRGLAFRGDAELTRDAGMGRALLIEMALLNEEIDLCQAILAGAAGPVPIYNGAYPDPPVMPNPGTLTVNARVKPVKEYDPHPSIRAAAIPTPDRKGLLLLVADFAFGAQHQPPQAAMNEVNLTVPAPESAQGYEISPGGVRPLDELGRRQRVPGGVRVILPDFGMSALVLLTTDAELVQRIEAQIARVRPMAVQLAIEQARIKHQWVADVIGRLVADGHKLYDPTDPKTPPLAPGVPTPNDEVELLAKSEESIKSAEEARERAAGNNNPDDYQLAWDEARRSGRALRHLMHAHWNKAFGAMIREVAPPDEPKPRPLRSVYTPAPKEVKKPPVFVTAVSSPPLVAFNTLPQHYIWLDWMKKPYWRNLLPSGTFDDHDSLAEGGWVDVGYRQEGIRASVSTMRPTPPPKSKVAAKTKSSARSRSRPDAEADDETPPMIGHGKVLKMVVEPEDRALIDKNPPYFDHPVAAIRTPPIPVVPGQFVRISVWAQKEVPSPMGAGGLIISDSIGGEALQFRAPVLPKMSKIILFRRAAAKGTMTVTLGLAGFGEAIFDDLKVETVAESPDDEVARPRRPSGPSDTATRPPSTARPRR
jgi:hypothetical protein